MFVLKLCCGRQFLMMGKYYSLSRIYISIERQSINRLSLGEDPIDLYLEWDGGQWNCSAWRKAGQWLLRKKADMVLLRAIYTWNSCGVFLLRIVWDFGVIAALELAHKELIGFLQGTIQTCEEGCDICTISSQVFTCPNRYFILYILEKLL